nr:SRPBCC domain-containing protein [Rhodovarius crocodyli]
MAAPAQAPAPAVELPNRIEHRETLSVPLPAAWAILSDPAKVAACLPGAVLTRHEGALLEGRFTASLGPISASFAGQGEWACGEHAGSVRGRGRDGANAAEGMVEFSLSPAAQGSVLDVVLSWRLTGPLAQFSRPALLRGLVAGLADQFARNLERSARGEAPAKRLSIWALIRAWLTRR